MPGVLRKPSWSTMWARVLNETLFCRNRRPGRRGNNLSCCVNKIIGRENGVISRCLPRDKPFATANREILPGSRPGGHALPADPFRAGSGKKACGRWNRTGYCNRYFSITMPEPPTVSDPALKHEPAPPPLFGDPFDPA